MWCRVALNGEGIVYRRKSDGRAGRTEDGHESDMFVVCFKGVVE